MEGFTLIRCPEIPTQTPWYAIPIKLDIAAIRRGAREALAGTRRIETDPEPASAPCPENATARRLLPYHYDPPEGAR